MTRIARRMGAMALASALASMTGSGARAGDALVFTLVDGAAHGLPPLVLQVPHGYAPVQEATKRTEGPSLSVITLYPSYGPFVAGPVRCGHIMCGDEVGASISLAAAPARTQAAPLRQEMEARPEARLPGTVFADAPVPPGFDEAFSVTTAARPGRDYTHSHIDYLVRRDASGAQQVGSCGAEGAHPACRFSSYDPATHLLMTYSFPRSALAERDEIDARLRTMIAGWSVAAP